MKKVLSFVLSLMLLSSSVVYADAMKVTRISGRDRYETDIAVNQHMFPDQIGTNAAVIANGNDFKSALEGSYLASTIFVPFYLVGNGVSDRVINEMKRLDLSCAYVLGDVSLKKLHDNGIDTRRVASPFDEVDYDYFSNTDMEIFRYKENGSYYSSLDGYLGGDINRFILVNDNKIPDLLSIIPFAARAYNSNWTMIAPYNKIKDGFPAPYDMQCFSIIGGYNSIPGGIYSTLNKGRKASLNRIAGKDRYQTAVKIAQANNVAFKKRLSKTVILVSGESFPDALSSGVLAMYHNSPVLLTQKNRLNWHTKDYLKKNRIQNVIVVGGVNSVSDNVLNEIRNLR